MQVQTIKEIKNKFKEQWILIVNPVVSEQNEIIKGKVVAHSKNRDEIYRAAKSMKEKTAAIIFNGKIPQNSAIIL